MTAVPPGGGRRRALPDPRDLVALAGGAALVASPWLRWVRRGPGNTMSGREMIDAVVAVGDRVPALSAARLALLWYLVPAAGALLWVAVGFDRFRRSAAVAAAAVVGAVLFAFSRLVGVTDLGPGAALALLGAALALGASSGGSPR